MELMILDIYLIVVSSFAAGFIIRGLIEDQKG